MIHPHAVALHRDEPDGSPRNVWHGPRRRASTCSATASACGSAARVPLVAEVTPAAVRDLGLDEGAEVWAAVKATEIVVYAA